MCDASSGGVLRRSCQSERKDLRNETLELVLISFEVIAMVDFFGRHVYEWSLKCKLNILKDYEDLLVLVETYVHCISVILTHSYMYIYLNRQKVS